jgi:predicted transcriptional regulator
MGILGFLKGNHVSSSTTVGLTEIGKRKACEMNSTGPAFDVLNTLNDKGPSNVTEIAQDTGLDHNRVSAVVQSLKKSGYVREMGGNN